MYDVLYCPIIDSDHYYAVAVQMLHYHDDLDPPICRPATIADPLLSLSSMTP